MFVAGMIFGCLISTIGVLVGIVMEFKKEIEEAKKKKITWREFFKEMKMIAKAMKEAEKKNGKRR